MACKAKADACGWIVPTKIDAKTGKPDKAYCRKVAGIAKKTAPAAAKPAAAVPATPATPAKPAAPAAAAKKTATPPPAAAGAPAKAN